MAITNTIERGFPRFSQDGEGIRTYEVKYQSLTTAGEGVRAVAASLPQRGSFYNIDGEIDFQAILNSLSTERDPQVKARWLTTHTYATEKKTDCTENEDDDPLEEPAVVTWPTRVGLEGFPQDLDGNVVATSAGMPFETVEIEVYRLGCQVIRNVADWSPLTALGYYGKINSDTFRIDRWTFPKETARLVEWTGEKFFHQNCNRYYRTTMMLEFMERTTHDGQNVSGFDLQLLDAGFMQIGDNGDPVAIRDELGNLVTEAQPLDGFGSVAAQGDDPEFKRFRRYDKKNFAGLFAGIKW